MASTVQTPVCTHPPPSFARHEHSSSINGSFSQPAVHSFDSSRSVALTPSATPPPPRPTPQQQQMSFNINGGPPMNGMISRGGSFGAYGEIDGQQQQQQQQASQQYEHTAKPQIYTVSKDQHKYIYVWYSQFLNRPSIRMCLCMRWKSMGPPSCEDDLIPGSMRPKF